MPQVGITSRAWASPTVQRQCSPASSTDSATKVWAACEFVVQPTQVTDGACEMAWARICLGASVASRSCSMATTDEMPGRRMSKALASA